MSSASTAMRWASAFSAAPNPVIAARDMAESLARALDGRGADLLLLFIGAAHVPAAADVATVFREILKPGCLIGTGARGVVSSDHEIESGPAITAIAAHMPRVQARPFVMVNAAWVAAVDDPLEFARSTPDVSNSEIVMLLADPFTFDIAHALEAFNRHAPGLRVVGGMASAGVRPGGNVLILNDWISHEGGVGLGLAGALRADVVVSQGCRPIGPTLEVTRADQNVLVELDGEPALQRAEHVLRALPERERKHLKNGLYVGRPARSGASGQGDYLIRNLLGADRKRQALAVADRMEAREQIRFHVRDAETAGEDLGLMLAPQEFDAKARAALLFACNGRGRGLYGAADRDISTLQAALGGDVPAAGMFCAGEIGPVGGVNFLHGHTASIAILREAARTEG